MYANTKKKYLYFVKCHLWFRRKERNVPSLSDYHTAVIQLFNCVSVFFLLQLWSYPPSAQSQPCAEHHVVVLVCVLLLGGPAESQRGAYGQLIHTLPSVKSFLVNPF